MRHSAKNLASTAVQGVPAALAVAGNGAVAITVSHRKITSSWEMEQ